MRTQKLVRSSQRPKSKAVMQETQNPETQHKCHQIAEVKSRSDEDRRSSSRTASPCKRTSNLPVIPSMLGGSGSGSSPGMIKVPAPKCQSVPFLSRCFPYYFLRLNNSRNLDWHDHPGRQSRPVFSPREAAAFPVLHLMNRDLPGPVDRMGL